MGMEVVVLSGGFDPVHDGHVAMFEAAAHKYDYVVVGLNSDEWLARKKGKAFMPYHVRESILKSIKWVDEVWEFDDSDDSANALLHHASLQFANVTFGNGGDRKNGNFPELDYCKLAGIDIDDTLGGTSKINSSSDFLAQWRIESCQRDWGEWKVLNNYNNTTKVKELVVLPGQSLSWQKHQNRNEIWFIREGNATVYYSTDTEGTLNFVKKLKKHQSFNLYRNKWHQLVNEEDYVLSVIEIQYGDDCSESDILRKPRPSTRIRDVC
jgi:D-beta-D-heptose 7-phosphate kinase/D-beta-D-heptose 1-phosphate adenosyltransferase